ncbi:MAG: glycosyltransferase, partial [Actinomycetota bacterium]|nr:glycosyltransferase [Actinomycetota bacterium]
LHLCLGAILRSLGKEGELMVSLAKPGSVPGRYLENIPCRKLENPGGTGLPAAVNQALLEARGDYLAVVREDVLVRPDWLRHLLSALESDPGALAASALILDMDGNICHAGYRPSRTPDGKPLLLPLRKGERPSSVEGTDEVPALALYCALLRRRPALETGFLDEEGYLPPGTYGDVDWTLRARLYGFRFLVVHASQALRLGSMSAAESPVHDESSLRNLDFLLQRWSHAEGAFPLSIAEEASPPSSQVSRSGVHAQSSR